MKTIEERKMEVTKATNDALAHIKKEDRQNSTVLIIKFSLIYGVLALLLLLLSIM